jgi:hypothetical protein
VWTRFCGGFLDWLAHADSPSRKTSVAQQASGSIWQMLISGLARDFIPLLAHHFTKSVLLTSLKV